MKIDSPDVLIAHFLSSIKEFDSTDLHKSIGILLSQIDLLQEYGVVDPKKLQNTKLFARIDLRENNQYLLERVRIVPNHQQVPSIWEQ